MSLHYPAVFPEIDLNNGYCLREHNSNDAESFLEYYTDEIDQYILAPTPHTLKEAESEIHYCKNLFYFKRGIYWSICHKKHNKMIGGIGISINAANKRAEIHYDLGKRYWGKHIITNAINEVTRFAINQLGVIRIEALLLKENIPSAKVLTKNNYQHEGCLHHYKFYNNQAYDVEIYAITDDIMGNN